jgi:hypothetical protein
VLLLAVLALLLGTALGLGGSWALAWLDAESAGPQRTIPQYTGQLPSDASTRIGDPALAPQITGLVDHGTSITLTWSDPSDGEAGFAVYRIDEDRWEGLLSIDPGTTTAEVVGLDPQAAEYCFQIVAYTPNSEAAGISPKRCTDSR